MVKASQKILALCLCLALMMSIVPAAFAEAGSDFDSLQIGDSAAFDVAEGVIATVDGTGCKSIEEISAAAAGGGRITLVDDLNDPDATIEIKKDTVLDLNGHGIRAKIIVTGSLTIEGKGQVSALPVLLNGGSLSVRGGTYSKTAISKYIPTGYMLNKIAEDSYEVVPRTSVSNAVVAMVDGTEYYDVADINSYLESASAKVVLNQDLAGSLTFRTGGELDLNGHTISGDVKNYGASLVIRDSGSSGGINGKVSNPAGGEITIYGGKFSSEPNHSFIAKGYGWDQGESRVYPVERMNEAMIGSTYYSTLADALEAARSGDTITALEKTSGTPGNYPAFTEDIEKNISLELGSNGIDALSIKGANVSINRGFVGTLTAANGAVLTVTGTRFDNIPTIDETSAVRSNVSFTKRGLGRYIKGSGAGLSFVCGQSLKDGKIAVNGQATAEGTDYALSENNMTITFTPDYLDKLEAGQYSVRLLTGRGEFAQGTFEVLEDTAPEVSIENSPYKKDAGEEITASPVSNEDYTDFAYSDKNDGSGLILLEKTSYTHLNNTLALNRQFLNALARGTYYLYGYRTSIDQYRYCGSFEIQDKDPEITQHPVSRSVSDGERVTFTVRVSGENVEYQWLRRSSEAERWELVGTAASYSFVARLSDNGSQYRCVVSTGAGQTQESEIALLTVGTAAPTIAVQPQNRTVTSGEEAAFSVSANGGELSYQWFYRESSREQWKELKGETDSTLRLTAARDKNGYEYCCEVKNDKGSVRSSAASLTVTRPVSLKAPENVSARERVEGDIEVSWAPSEYAVQYRVYRKAADGVDEVMLADVTDTTYLDKSAQADPKGEKSYTYLVRCVKADGSFESDLSQESDPVTFYGAAVTVSFNSNSGRNIPSQTLVKMQKASKPASFKNGTYWFAGWCSDSELKNLFDFDTPVAESITLYAKWVKPDFIPPARLTEIGEEAFAGVAATAVKLGENVSSIGSRAFADCPNLSAIYIPAATKSIDENAFAGDSMLATIVGKSGSAAEAFAKDNGYEFVIGP